MYHYNLRYDLPFIHYQFFLLSGFEAEACIVCESSLCWKQPTCKVHNLMIFVQTHYWTIFSNQFSNMIKNIVLQARAKSWYFDLERNCSVEPVHIVDWNIRSARFAYTETCGFAETLCPICIRKPDFDLHTTRDIHIASCPTYEWRRYPHLCANNIRTFNF